MGTQIDKTIDISNSFPINHKFVEVSRSSVEGEEGGGGKTLQIDTDYVMKMLKFYRQVNSSEICLGVYISSNVMNSECMIIMQYFANLLKDKKVKSPLDSPIVLLFDPKLQNDKLDIKVLNLHSTFFKECPVFSEMPF